MNYPELELYIDGRWKRAAGQVVLNPADETVLGTVPAATIADLDDAIAAAERGFKVWRKTSPAERDSAVIQRFEGHLGGDLESGRWDERFGHLRSQLCFLGSLKVIIGQT